MRHHLPMILRVLRWMWLSTYVVLAFRFVTPHLLAASSLVVNDCSTLGSIATPGTLGYALAVHATGDQIAFTCDGTLTFAAPFTLTDEVALNATGHHIILNGGATGPGVGTPFFTITPTGHMHVTHLTFAQGGNVTIGGAITNHGVLDVSDCLFQHNNADWYSGAIANYNDGNTTITASQFIDNSVGIHGGGAISNDGNLSIADSTFTHNAAGEDGGAVQNDGHLTLTTSTFTNNTAGTDGAALSNSVQATVTQSVFTNNHATLVGGALSNHGILTLTMDLFNSNIAGRYSGAFGNYGDGTATITGSTFSNNQAVAHNGGALANDGHLDITASTFVGNLAGQSGGGISDGGPLSIIDSTISDNRANTAGGITVIPASSVIVAGSIVARNTGGNCDQAISGGYNSVDDGSCGLLSTDVMGTVTLGPLVLAGGQVPTESPLTGSPAIDAIPPGTTVTFGGATMALCTGTDARGVVRPFGPQCDSGAVEIAPPAITILVPTAGSTFMYGQRVLASYGCTDGSDPAVLASCSGNYLTTQQLNTLSIGPQTMSVRAVDVGGFQLNQTNLFSVVQAATTIRLLQTVVSKHKAMVIFQLLASAPQIAQATPPSGLVSISSNGQQLAIISLDSAGRGTATLAWNGTGNYTLWYQGDRDYATQSMPVIVPAIVLRSCRIFGWQHFPCQLQTLRDKTTLAHGEAAYPCSCSRSA